MRLSIIIPTLNEEKYLPLLLNSIRQQNIRRGEEDKSSSLPSLSLGESSVYEVIVADAGSKDGTLEVARSFGGKVVAGGSPARGRNEGAKAARGDLLLFLDADVILPPGFLEDFLKKFEEKKLDIASAAFMIIEKKPIYRLGEALFNLYFKINQHFFPCAGGFCILVKKELHQKLGGFDETIKVEEDFFYARSAKKKAAKFHFFWSPKFFLSARRIEKEGKIKSLFKYLAIEIHNIFFGPVRSDIFKYKFDHYSEKEK